MRDPLIEDKSCVHIDWWRKPEYKERYDKVCSILKSQGYKCRPYMSTFLSENSEMRNTIIEIRRHNYPFGAGLLFLLCLWKEDSIHYAYTLNIEGNANFEGAKKLANVLCLMMGRRVYLT